MKYKYLIGFVCVAGLWGCASSGDIHRLDQRIRHLEGQNSDLSTQLHAEKQQATALSTEMEAFRTAHEQSDQEIRLKNATLTATVDQLRRELRVVTGKLEEADYSIAQGRSMLSNNTQDKENRLNRIEEIGRLNRERIVRLEQYLDFESSLDDLKAPADTGKKKVTKEKKQLPETELYESAKQAFDRGEFEVAREQFIEFLKRFPKSGNADNCQFWIGEIYYREKWYEKAIMEYQKVIESYPDGNKVPAALLKQGLAFFNLDEKANARLILKEMIRKYPASNEAKIAKEKLSSLN